MAYGTSPTPLPTTDVTSHLTIPLVVQYARSVKRPEENASTIPEKAKPDGQLYTERIASSNENETKHASYLL